MQIVPLYRDVAAALEPVQDARLAWPRFEALPYRRYRPFFDGLIDTYGHQFFGPGGLPTAVEQLGPALRSALAPAPGYQMEERTRLILEPVGRLLPTALPPIYLGTLFFTAPAATISVGGRPAIALALERFHTAPPVTPVKYWYRPDEVEEMLPHEAAHASRMEVLGLPPTPRNLSLLDMVMLEGTALTFTDHLLGRMTLATFMPAHHLADHQQNQSAILPLAAKDFGRRGLEAFADYFASDAPISGYYVGWRLCRDYLDRFGDDALPSLLTMPSQEILDRLAA